MSDAVYGLLDGMAITLLSMYGLIAGYTEGIWDIAIVMSLAIIWSVARYWLHINRDAPPLPWDGAGWRLYNQK